MKAIKIDPLERSISEIDFYDDYKRLQELVGGYFETYSVTPDIAIAVHEERHPERGGFRYRGALTSFTGIGIIFGFDTDGNTVDVPLTVEDVEAQIQWLPHI